MGDDRDAGSTQPSRIADARALEQQRAFHRTSAHHHFAATIEPARLAVDAGLDRHGAPSIEHDAFGQRTGDHRDVAAQPRRGKERHRRALPAAPADVVAEQSDAGTGIAVEIADPFQADRLARLDHAFRQRIGMDCRIDMDAPAAAAHRAGACGVVFKCEQGPGHAGGVPAGRPGRFPAIVVRRLAPAPDHAVDRRRSAQPLAANPYLVCRAARLARLADGIGPDMFGPGHQLCHALGQAYPETVVLAARLQHQHARPAVGAQPFGQHAACRAGANHDIVPRALFRRPVSRCIAHAAPLLGATLSQRPETRP